MAGSMAEGAAEAPMPDAPVGANANAGTSTTTTTRTSTGAAAEAVWLRSPIAWLSDAMFERLVWVAVCVVAFIPYLVINRVTASWPAIDLTFAVDAWVPFDPRWELVYLSVYLVVFLPGVQIKHPALFRRAIASFLVMQAIAYPIFLLMPVGIDRPDALVDPSAGFAQWMLAFNYAHDAPRNLFPSLHVANAVLTGLEAWRVDRKVGVVALIIAAAIAYSTLAVKQHALVDVVVGAVMAYAVYRAIFRPFPLEGLRPDEVRFPRWLLVIGPVAWVVGMSAFYACMHFGVELFAWPLPGAAAGG